MQRRISDVRDRRAGLAAPFSKKEATTFACEDEAFKVVQHCNAGDGGESHRPSALCLA